MTKFAVLTGQESEHIPCVVFCCKNNARRKVKQKKKMFIYCTVDRINEDNNAFQQLRQSARRNIIKTDMVQPSWWTESTHQAWLSKKQQQKNMAKGAEK